MTPPRFVALTSQLALVLLAACGGDLTNHPAEPVAISIDRPGLMVADAPDAPARPPQSDMVFVPAGPFARGCATADTVCFANERPLRSIHLAPFYIDRTEVTVAAYRACVATGSCSDAGLGTHTPSTVTRISPQDGHNTSRFQAPQESATCNYTAPGRSRYPVNCVNWDQARVFCAWAGKRLPTEAEWEKAARGNDERIYTWGDAPPSCQLTVMSEGGNGCGAQLTAPVGSRPRGQSPAGALDMIGNVIEWVSDWYQEDYYASSPAVDPKGPPVGRFRGVRGGTWRNRVDGTINALRISNRYSYVPDAHLDYVGFRCARDAR